MAANEPTREIGMATLTMLVVVRDWRKKRLTRTTTAKAMVRVIQTCFMASRTKMVKSVATESSIPSGSVGSISSISALTAVEISSSFDCDWGTIPTPTTSRAEYRVIAW